MDDEQLDVVVFKYLEKKGYEVCAMRCPVVLVYMQSFEFCARAFFIDQTSRSQQEALLPCRVRY